MRNNVTDSAAAVILPVREPRAGAVLPHHLSPRQREIAALIADGMTNQEIGEKLGIHPSTVDNHRRGIYHKLGVDNIAHLTQYALAKAWIRNRFAGRGRPPKPKD